MASAAAVAAAGRKSVAVIGAGAAGLACLSVMRHSTDVVAFEKSGEIGGVWNFDEDPESGPMYADLHTNLPKEIMAFPDMPWETDDPRSFLHHTQVAEYLRNYGESMGLLPHIRFNTRVTAVSPCKQGGWQLETDSCSDSQQPHHQQHHFDCIVVANGHFSLEHSPTLPGQSSFTGRLLHSRRYRRRGEFAGQRVAVLGAGPSGTDVALELSTACECVLLCHRGERLQCQLPANVRQLTQIVRLDGDSIVCEDGERAACDCVLLCTGYRYSFPFLPACVPVTDCHVPNLHEHVIQCDWPDSLFFVGLCGSILPFPQFWLQAKVALACLLGRLRLPEDAAEKSATREEQLLRLGVPEWRLHRLSSAQWDYNDRLADMAECERLPPVVRKIYEDVHEQRRVSLVDYKRLAYRVVDSNTFQRIQPARPTE